MSPGESTKLIKQIDAVSGIQVERVYELTVDAAGRRITHKGWGSESMKRECQPEKEAEAEHYC